MFLRIKDYYKQIQKTNFEQILEQAKGVSGDTEILEFTENTAVSFIKNHIQGRYRVGDIFASLEHFSEASNYTYGSRVDIDADAYVAITAYTVGIRVKYLANVYECILTSTGNLPTNVTYWKLIGQEGIYNIPFPERFDDRIYYADGDRINLDFIVYEKNDNLSGYKEGIAPTNSLYFDVIQKAAYPVTTGVLPIAAPWKFSDNRDLTLIRIVIDVVLYDIHSIINPRNIPQLRTDRYNSVVEFLKEVVNGKMNMDLPVYGASKGYRLRAGSRPPFNNIY